MTFRLSENLKRIVILDTSGIYAQIHNQGYFEEIEADEIKQVYRDTNKWKVIEL